jgi:hypothetical protein
VQRRSRSAETRRQTKDGERRRWQKTQRKEAEEHGGENGVQKTIPKRNAK